MKSVLVSACLLGQPVRYDGKDKRTRHPVLERWVAEGRVVALCPEVAGGLAIPRPPAERIEGRVITNTGLDVTSAFERGAERAVALAAELQLTVAVLKEGSPSCGSHVIGDGSFSKTKIAGAGLTTEALRTHGVQVFSEDELEAADAALTASEAR